MSGSSVFILLKVRELLFQWARQKVWPFDIITEKSVEILVIGSRTTLK